MLVNGTHFYYLFDTLLDSTIFLTHPFRFDTNISVQLYLVQLLRATTVVRIYANFQFFKVTVGTCVGEATTDLMQNTCFVLPWVVVQFCTMYECIMHADAKENYSIL